MAPSSQELEPPEKPERFIKLNLQQTPRQLALCLSVRVRRQHAACVFQSVAVVRVCEPSGNFARSVRNVIYFLLVQVLRDGFAKAGLDFIEARRQISARERVELFPCHVAPSYANAMQESGNVRLPQGSSMLGFLWIARAQTAKYFAAAKDGTKVCRDENPADVGVASAS